VHKSHLLNCKETQLNWNEKRKRYMKNDNPFAAMTPKELCK